jgi:hypothetical protein
MTTRTSTTRSGTARILGVGALACIACCIGPVVGLLGAIGVATIVGTLTLGIAGLAVALLVVPLLRSRRRRIICAAPLAREVAVDAPTCRRSD